MKSLNATLGAIAVGAAALAAGTATASTVKDVDLVFVIDRSGSMTNEGATLSAQIGNFITGLEADASIGNVEAGVLSFEGSPGIELVSAVTGDVGALQTAISGISYGGGNEDGLGALASALPGGSFFNALGWNNNTVKSLVLLTDENDDPPAPNDYAAFQQTLLNVGYLNNVIVSGGGNDYCAATNPVVGACFSLTQFTTDTSAFLNGFITAKIGEIGGTDPTGGSGAVPLPAAGWLMIAGMGGLAAVRRRKAKS